jgi:hypothetical protein
VTGSEGQARGLRLEAEGGLSRPWVAADGSLSLPAARGPTPMAESRSTPLPSGTDPDPSAAGALVARRGRDRRATPTPRFSRYSLFGGRRRGPRRAHEREGSFVDRYGPRLWLLVLWVALMNIGDTYFTLVHLQAGGVEVNPVADRLLQTGRVGFVLAKSVLIGLALLVLAIHKNFWLARLGLFTSAGIYTLLCLYHLTLYRHG